MTTSEVVVGLALATDRGRGGEGERESGEYEMGAFGGGGLGERECV